MHCLECLENPFEFDELLGGVAPLSHFHRVPPTVGMLPYGQAFLPLGFSAPKFKQKKRFRLLHDKEWEQRHNRRNRRPVMEAPRDEIPWVRSLVLPHGK